MKKKLVAAAIALVSASALAQTVFCPDMGGYTKVQTFGFGYETAGMNFMTGTGNTVQETIGDYMPLGSQVWTQTAGVYDPVLTYTYYGTTTPGSPPTYTTNGIAWVETFNDLPSTRVIEPGEGFWLVDRGPYGAASEVVIAGRVVSDATVTNSIYSGHTLISSPYPVEVAVTNFGFNPTIGDEIYTWNATTWGYDNILKYTYYGTITPASPNPIYTTNGIGWVEAFDMPVSGVTIPIGKGFWYNSVASTTKEWVMDRPFDLE